jgi:hypothetical protein
MAAERIAKQNEVYDFLLSKPSPEQIIAYRPSEESQTRLRYLLDASRNNQLSPEESAELDDYMQIEHFMRMLKARDRTHAQS